MHTNCRVDRSMLVNFYAVTKTFIEYLNSMIMTKNVRV